VAQPVVADGGALSRLEQADDGGSLELNAGTAIDRRLVFAEALLLMSDGSENSDEQPSVDRRR